MDNRFGKKFNTSKAVQEFLQSEHSTEPEADDSDMDYFPSPEKLPKW